MRDLKIYTDGAARGNPGPSASGFMIYDNKRVLHRQSEYNGTATNNFAEYNAILLALRWCKSNVSNSHDTSIDLYADSELVVRQLNGKYKVKSESLKPLHDEVRKLVKEFNEVKFSNLRREDINISAVDKALNVLLDERTGQENK